MAKPWWRGHLMRIYHPNVREFEQADLDVPQFIADCQATQADSIVVSAGGIYAFYPGEVPYHYVSPIIGERDLLGEIVEEARRHGLRVIARVDFAQARENVYNDHPEWFSRDATGEVVRAGSYYRTCPMGGYQGEEFAHPVLREMIGRYGVDGFHLNNGGFFGICYCDSCREAFGRPIPTGPDDPELWERFLRWRREANAKQMATLYNVAREAAPETFWMAELAGPESPPWAYKAGQHLPCLARSFSRLLVTSGGVGSSRTSRWWPAIAADLARAARRRRAPLINIKMQMRDLNMAHAFMPAAEFALYAYQSLAHGAGLKTPTFGLPKNQLDPRTMPTLTEVFSFMRRQQTVLDSMELIAQVALVWPGLALLKTEGATPKATEGLRGEFVGLYHALTSGHVLFDVIYDEQITTRRLRRYESVVLVTLQGLDPAALRALRSYAKDGGRVLLIDGSADADGRFAPLPDEWVAMMSGEWSSESGRGDYALPADEPSGAIPTALNDMGPIPLMGPVRRHLPGPDSRAWLYPSESEERVIPEDIGAPVPATYPLATVTPLGADQIVYVGAGLGGMILQSGLPDYALLLETMLHYGAGEMPRLMTDAPGSVGITMAHCKGGVVIHLVNAAGPAPLDAPAPVGPITLDVAWDGPAVADLCAPGIEAQPLRCEEAWNRVRITVPGISSYAQVVIRSA
jgi:hypothetical protein